MDQYRYNPVTYAVTVTLLAGTCRTFHNRVNDLQMGGIKCESDVNQFLIEPFINYNLDGGWYLIIDSIITANWDAPSGQKWTVPLGGGAGKLFTIGKQPINARLEAYYMVERPDNAPDWQIIGTFVFLFPKK